MNDVLKIRWGWLKFMHIYTIFVAGGCGLGMILSPNFIKFILRLPQQDPIAFSIIGSVYLAFGLLSILGL